MSQTRILCPDCGCPLCWCECGAVDKRFTITQDLAPNDIPATLTVVDDATSPTGKAWCLDNSKGATAAYLTVPAVERPNPVILTVKKEASDGMYETTCTGEECSFCKPCDNLKKELADLKISAAGYSTLKAGEEIKALKAERDRYKTALLEIRFSQKGCLGNGIVEEDSCDTMMRFALKALGGEW